MNHRKPVLHPEIKKCNQLHKKLGYGYCKVCGKIIAKKDGTPNLRRVFCSSKCRRYFLDLCYLFFYHQTAVRHLLYRRDKGVCRKCGKKGQWDADHIIPLALVDRKKKDAYKHWTLDNLQTLCRKCHKEKTKEDMKKIRLKRV